MDAPRGKEEILIQQQREGNSYHLSCSLLEIDN